MTRSFALVAALGLAAGFAACSGSGDGETSSGGGAAAGGSGGLGGAGGSGGAGGPTASTASGAGGSGGGATVGSGGTGGSGGDGGQGGGCANLLPTILEAPATLSATALYDDIATKAIAAHARPYQPTFRLWSDGLDKHRFIYLPECGTIDTSNMDDWNFPPGTRAWKEFSDGGKRLETRFMVRTGTGPKDILYATYRWNEEQTDATLVVGGEKNVLGTDHDIPDELSCRRCHGPHPAKGGLPSRFLGFGALQLSHSGAGVTLSALIDEGRLSSPPSGPLTFPGNAVERAALGLLHANCGNCHNDSSDGIVFPGFNARVRSTDATPEATGAYTTMVNQKTFLFIGHGCSYRIAGGNVDDSCGVLRMKERGTDENPNIKQMPPLGSEVVDAEGVAAIEAWIATLPPPAP